MAIEGGPNPGRGQTGNANSSSGRGSQQPNKQTEVNQTGTQSLPERLKREDGSPIPYGFADAAQYETFVETLKSDLPEGVQAIFQGSAVTGRNSKTREVFDAGRLSDFDIALTGGDLFEKAANLGYKAKDGTRIGPLNEEQLGKLGLDALASKLSQQAGREAGFMLFKSVTDAYKRPSILVY